MTDSPVMTAFEAMHAFRLGQHSRCRSSLERLPKKCIQNLYRHYVCPPRNEDKSDMVAVMWRRYQDGKDALAFWAYVEDEWKYVERCREAKKNGNPIPKI